MGYSFDSPTWTSLCRNAKTSIMFAFFFVADTMYRLLVFT